MDKIGSIFFATTSPSGNLSAADSGHVKGAGGLGGILKLLGGAESGGGADDRGGAFLGMSVVKCVIKLLLTPARISPDLSAVHAHHTGLPLKGIVWGGGERENVFSL